MILPPKTFIIGACGFLGRALYQYYRFFHSNLTGTHHEKTREFKLLNLMDPQLEFLDLSGYSYAIIAAASPNLRKCELESKHTHLINVQGTLKLVEKLIEKKITPVVFSSDYVFDGKNGSYDEQSEVNPLNEYGKQKRELEVLIEQNFKNKTLIIRLSKVFGLQKGDRTLLDEMMQFLAADIPVKAAYDQVFCPIEAGDAVQAIALLQKMNARGLYHVCGNEPISRLDLARKIGSVLQVRTELIEPISLDDLRDFFQRPKRTDMINYKLRSATGIQIKSLSSSIEFLAQQYKNKGEK